MSKPFQILALLLLVTSVFLDTQPADARTKKRPRPSEPIYRPVYKSTERDMSTFHSMGVGLILGEPTGVSGIYKLDPRNAFDVALGYSTIDSSHLQLHGDYLFIFPGMFNFQSYYFDPYFGGGVQYRGFDKTFFGVRVPLGVSTYFTTEKVWEGFAEIAPGFNFVSDTHFTFDIDIGARYYFF